MTSRSSCLDVRSSVIGAVMVAAFCLSCSSPLDVTTYPATAVVYGIVRDVSDHPVVGVYVVAQVWTIGCGTRISSASSVVNPITDGAGRYSILMQLPTADGRCVRLLAARAPRADSLVRSLPEVSFRFANTDSVRADLRLP